MIDRALEQNPADFDALLKLLSEMGCEVSRRGKAIRLKAPGWKNVARMDEMCIRDRLTLPMEPAVPMLIRFWRTA